MITMLGCLERLKVVIGSLRMVRGWLLARLRPYPESRIFEVSGRISLANSLAATPSSEDLKPFSHTLLPLYPILSRRPHFFTLWHLPPPNQPLLSTIANKHPATPESPTRLSRTASALRTQPWLQPSPHNDSHTLQTATDPTSFPFTQSRQASELGVCRERQQFKIAPKKFPTPAKLLNEIGEYRARGSTPLAPVQNTFYIP